MVLTGIEFCSVPFPYFVANHAFSRTAANSLLRWLEREVPWQLHKEYFFEQYECNLLQQSVPSQCRNMFTESVIAKIRARVAGLFETELTDKVSITAHKLTPGQGIGVHNDNPERGEETHRLVVHLNHGFKDSYGGHMIFLNRNNPKDINRIFRPIHNSAIGFALLSNSYHAVGDVFKGQRYTIVYSFWGKSTPAAKLNRAAMSWKRQRETYARRSVSTNGRGLEGLTDFLQSVGAGETRHSHANLLAHLVNVYKILRRWKCSGYICKAGMFHSIYGTESFQQKTLSTNERRLVTNRIGEKAEQLAFLYARSSRESLYSNLDHAQPYSLRDFVTGKVVKIDERALAELLTIDLANTLEQLPRISFGEQMSEEKQLYEKATKYLPRQAVEEMRGLLR